ncbi:MAG: hypothetical protein R3C56_12850 [Pirellulaceae bacterium]
MAALGLGGEGYLSFSIAGPTGEGVTSPLTFTRERRCSLTRICGFWVSRREVIKETPLPACPGRGRSFEIRERQIAYSYQASRRRHSIGIAATRDKTSLLPGKPGEGAGKNKKIMTCMALVVGHAHSTVKHKTLQSHAVGNATADGPTAARPDGGPLLAVDRQGAGIGE